MWQNEQDAVAKHKLGKLPIVEARMPLRFFVSDDDCKQAKRGDPQRCAFACAVKRIMGKEHGIIFFRRIAYVNVGKQIERYLLSPEAAEAVRVFDRTGTFKAGEYRLLRPSKPSHRSAPKSTAHSPGGGRKKPKGRWLGVRNGMGKATILREAVKA